MSDGFLLGYSLGLSNGLLLGVLGREILGPFENRETYSRIGMRAEVESEEGRQSLEKELKALSEKYQLRLLIADKSGKNVEYGLGEFFSDRKS